MRTVSISLALTLGLTASALSACGDRPSAESAPRGTAVEQQLRLDRGADSSIGVGVDGDDVLVVTTSDDGVLGSHFSVGGADFRAGDPLETRRTTATLTDPVRLDDGSWYAVGVGGVERSDGEEELSHEPFAVRSADGLTWELVEVSGFALPADVEDLAVEGGRLLAVGAYRTAADASHGGFTAQVWSSEDGVRFAEVDLPGVPEYRGYRSESFASEVAKTSQGVVVAGGVGDRAAVWTSTGSDDWIAVEDENLADAYRVIGLEAAGDTVLATVGGGPARAVRSADAGASWEAVPGLVPPGDEEDWTPLWRAGDRFLTWQPAAGGGETDWFSPEVCYADLDQCGEQPPPVVVAGAASGSWAPVDLGASDELEAVVGTADGRVLAVDATARGARVRAWDSWDDVPAAATVAEPETVQVTTLGQGEVPEEGTTYAYPLFTHCGIERTWFGEQTWRRTDDGSRAGPRSWTGAPKGWPAAAGYVYGYATLEGDGSMTYTDGEGEVLATYEPARRPFFCD
ncbi:hypothetical protein FXB39_15955 [Nocardioides sp. BGMRC 2183]|nr:hypothetical protein FXB39_15955 [Nocardioides sp. BGMRC 2183]